MSQLPYCYSNQHVINWASLSLRRPGKAGHSRRQARRLLPEPALCLRLPGCSPRRTLSTRAIRRGPSASRPPPFLSTPRGVWAMAINGSWNKRCGSGRRRSVASGHSFKTRSRSRDSRCCARAGEESITCCEPRHFRLADQDVASAKLIIGAELQAGPRSEASGEPFHGAVAEAICVPVRCQCEPY